MEKVDQLHLHILKSAHVVQCNLNGHMLPYQLLSCFFLPMSVKSILLNKFADKHGNRSMNNFQWSLIYRALFVQIITYANDD